MKRSPIAIRTELQRLELKLQNESVKCSRTFNSKITSLTIIAKGNDKNTGKPVSHIFDYSQANDIPAEFYDFLNAYGAANIARRDIIRHRLKMMTADI